MDTRGFESGLAAMKGDERQQINAILETVAMSCTFARESLRGLEAQLTHIENVLSLLRLALDKAAGGSV